MRPSETGRRSSWAAPASGAAPAARLLAAIAVVVVGGCHRPLETPDARIPDADAASSVADARKSDGGPDTAQVADAGQSDGGPDAAQVADAGQSDGGPDATACYPLFHACTGSEQCCAPNLCLNITGTPACQVEGPGPTPFTSWTSCGWSGGSCLCDGIKACQAIAGGSFSSLGSQQARVCAIDGEVCEYVVFVETEGGGTARRCRVPIGSGSCLAGFSSTPDSHCVDLFTCNLLMGTCPPDIVPGTSVIACR
jgi:hypothetical protein